MGPEYQAPCKLPVAQFQSLLAFPDLVVEHSKGLLSDRNLKQRSTLDYFQLDFKPVPSG